ncbi:MAG TPA: MBL fold metallo-hydrolase [Anaerolineales bacterium]
MAHESIALAEVDDARLTVIMDNSIDVLMANTEVAQRWKMGSHPFDHPQPMAEHGFSVLIEVRQGDRTNKVLFDTGVSRKGILYNLDVLERKANDIRAIILSHGHADHAMGLPGFIDRLGTLGLPLVLHPDAFLERKLVLPNGDEVHIPPPSKADLRRESVELIESVGPSMLVDNMVLVSGEVSRTTEFETGFRVHYSRRNDVWEPDPLIMDDQCAVLNVRGKGLVVITGCGHSGIINILRHARRLTGVQAIYGVVGGFHLTGALFEPIIPATIAALQEIKPRYVMPGHCTGWKAVHQIAAAMPQAFIASSVGTTLTL